MSDLFESLPECQTLSRSSTPDDVADNISSSFQQLPRMRPASSWRTAGSARGSWRKKNIALPPPEPSIFELERSFHELSHLESEAAQDGRVSAALVHGTTQVAELGPEFASFTLDEIKVGKFLGKGSFSKLEEIQSIRLHDDTTTVWSVHASDTAHYCEKKEAYQVVTCSEQSEDSHTQKKKLSNREFVAAHCIRPCSGDARYALKRIRPEIIQDQAKEKQFWSAAVDLAIEARFLASLEHPHIIKLRGVAVGNPLTKKGHYFLVLDRLYDTLAKRMVAWKSEQDSILYLWKKHTKTGQALWRDILTERVSKAYDLSSAIVHMHERRICHRDIKPENVGFDVRGDVKIFDLGLARELPRPDGDDAAAAAATYLLSKAGSLRFMAPEVALGQPYNEFCDVYSFSLLLWQMITCKRPFEKFTDEKAFCRAVHQKHCRPRVWTYHKLWPKPLAESIIKKGWDADWKIRPNMPEIESILCRELITLRNGDKSAHMDKTRRRSTSIYRHSDATGTVRQNIAEAMEDFNISFATVGHAPSE